MSWSASKLGVRLVLWGWFLLSSGIFYWPFWGGASFVDHLCFFCRVFVVPLCASVCLYLVVTCWEKAGLLALVCDVSL